MEGGSMGSLLSIAPVIALAGSIATGLLKRFIGNMNPPLVNLGLCMVAAMLFAATLPRVFAELPSDLASWLSYGAAGAGLGGASHYTARRAREKKEAVRP